MKFIKYDFANAQIDKSTEASFHIGGVSPSLGMAIPNISLALPMKKLAFSS